MKIVALFCFFITLTSCSAEKHFYYPFSEKNNKIIENVYRKGKVSCGIYGYCLRVDNIESTPKHYIIKGGPVIRINNIIVKVISKSDAKEFNVEVKSSSIIFRNKEFNEKLLDEITSVLFANNVDNVDNFLKESAKENKKNL